jgi:hypothetical protein
MEGICCFWLLARTTMRNVRAGWAARAVLAGVKHRVRVSIAQAILSCCGACLRCRVTAGPIQRLKVGKLGSMQTELACCSCEPSP